MWLKFNANNSHWAQLDLEYSIFMNLYEPLWTVLLAYVRMKWKWSSGVMWKLLSWIASDKNVAASKSRDDSVEANVAVFAQSLYFLNGLKCLTMFTEDPNVLIKLVWTGTGSSTFNYFFKEIMKVRHVAQLFFFCLFCVCVCVQSFYHYSIPRTHTF